jgi:hypothetical protein
VEKARSCVSEGVLQVAARDYTDHVRGVAGWDPAKKEVCVGQIIGGRGAVFGQDWAIV